MTSAMECIPSPRQDRTTNWFNSFCIKSETNTMTYIKKYKHSYNIHTTFTTGKKKKKQKTKSGSDFRVTALKGSTADRGIEKEKEKERARERGRARAREDGNFH